MTKSPIVSHRIRPCRLQGEEGWQEATTLGFLLQAGRQACGHTEHSPLHRPRPPPPSKAA